MLTLIASCAPPVTPDVTDIVRYVATDGDDTNDGSEEFPWLTIQYALDNIPTLGTILVKDGVYNESISFPSDKKIILQSVKGDFSTTIIGDNNLPTVTCSNSLEGTTLEGFTISHNPADSGSGTDISGGYLNIDNCTISNNSAYDCGGIYNGSDGTLNITSSTISSNYSDNGGGIDNDGTLTITTSTISRNSATYNGGGIYNKGTLTITEGSTISHNSAAYGGGISNYEYGILTITASTITHNFATNYSGGIYNKGILTITASTITHNFATNYSGGIVNTGTLTITASTISYNSGAYGGGIDNGGTLTIAASTISYNSATVNGGGIYLSGLGTPTIGGSGEEKNTICGNYKTGEPPSLDQQIRDNSGSLYDTYSSTNYISAFCPL